MAKKLKTYNVGVKALKTAPAVNLRLDFLKNGEKIYEQTRKAKPNLSSIVLTDKKYKMEDLYPYPDYMERASFPANDFNVDQLTTMNQMFSNCYAATAFDVSNFDTSNVTDLSEMFKGCNVLTDINLSSFDTSNVTELSAMFKFCYALTSIDLSTFNIKKSIDCRDMFSDCSSLRSVKMFDTSMLRSAPYMFSGCKNLETIDGVIDLGNARMSYWGKTFGNYEKMFNNCSKLSGVKIKNILPDDIVHDGETGLNKLGLRADQYEIIE